MAAMGDGDDSEVIDSDDDDDESSEGDDLDNSSDSEDDLDDLEEDNDDDEVDDEIMDKFICTFSNGNYDAEFDEALIFPDRSVPVPARPTQASYNKPDNWIERNRIGLEKVKRELQNLVESVTLCHKYFRLSMRQNSQRDQLVDNEEQIVWHEPVLQEYWDQLKTLTDQTEIDQRKQLGMVTDITGIHIQNVEMTKEHLTALVDIFRSGRATNSSDTVNFFNVNLCEEGIIWLSKLIDVSSNLHELQLCHNRIDNMESACCLSRSLKLHTCIDRLYLTHCDLGSNPEILSVILQSEVKNIDLSNNNIDLLGAVKIAEYLESDSPIDCIDLNRNRLNDNDVILISQALKRNTNLTGINLLMNNITSIGVKALLTCLFDGSSLNSISESNHTLNEINIINGHNQSLDRCIDRLLELVRTDKIVLALQDKDSLLKYLANVPVELIPEVLAFPLQPVINQPLHKHLNIVYSTMRWWNMPMLYSYHYNCSVKPDSKRKRD